MTLALALSLSVLGALDGGVAPAELSRTDELERRVLDLERRLALTQSQVAAAEERAEQRAKFAVEVGGYVDVGFFAVQGDGSGVRPDYQRHFPQYGDVLSSWVLVGDPLSTTVNSRGEVADLGASRALREDTLDSQGRPTFLLNALNVSLRGDVGDDWHFSALVDFLPRERVVVGGAFGDLLDVKVASVRWQREFSWGSLAVVAGKHDSVHGFEYRTQESPQRLTVTPSLLCRYTCGRPVGLKARATFLDERVELFLAVTNGSAQTEQFLFSNETDFNLFKTVHARVGVHLPVLGGLDLAVSGAVGSQDRQRDDSLLQYHLGAAARLEGEALQAHAEFVIGRAPGRALDTQACGAASCLTYRGAFGQVGYRVKLAWVPYVRVDWREATLRAGRDYVYVSNVLRATVGLRFEPLAHLAFKAEYTFNKELTPTEFPDDVFTTSLVVSY